MLKIFKKKASDDSWVASVKSLKMQRAGQYKELTRDEIKEEILREEDSSKGETTREIQFPRKTICKRDKKTLKKLGYYVYEGHTGDDEPCVYISW